MIFEYPASAFAKLHSYPLSYKGEMAGRPGLEPGNNGFGDRSLRQFAYRPIYFLSPEEVEPPTACLRGRSSGQLSYGHYLVPEAGPGPAINGL